MNATRSLVLTLTAILALTAIGQRAITAEAVPVTIHTDAKGAEINPFIYGQFIEHLGRCIYGGIWAEMLEDRKFFFPITEEYSPYKSLTNTPYPVVGASPWQIIGDPAGITMIAKDAFVGEHTPQVAGSGGIRQRDLAVVKDKQYKGHVWLRATEGTAGPVTISLIWGDEDSQQQVHTVPTVGSAYQKFNYDFTAGADSDAAMLELRVAGDTPVLIGTLSLMPADNVRGMRADTLALLKQLNAPMYRWPGGNFVSGYDWRDGIGPRDRRPPRKNPAWTGVEHNDMGIDEFIDFCREVDAVPLIAVNTGFGDAYSAAQEVEYCNGSTETTGGAWRAKNGHPEPYAVKYWCVGNEMFGPWQLGFMQLSHYAQKHNRCAAKMWEVDEDLVLIGVGNLKGINAKHDPDQKVGWTEGMLRECAPFMNQISEHFYRGRTPWNEENPNIEKHVALLRDSIREKADGHRALQAKLGLLPDKMVPIAMDEWNYWHQPYIYGELGCAYDLADALGVAAGLHEYFRQSDMIHMAHYAQTVNVIGCIKTTKTKAFLATTALPLKLYRQEFGVTPLKVTGDYEAKQLDVVAALTADGKAITIGIVNPHPDQRVVTAGIDAAEVAGKGKLWQIVGDKPTLTNSPDVQPITINGPQEIDFDGTLSVPPFSVSLYRLPLK